MTCIDRERFKLSRVRRRLLRVFRLAALRTMRRVAGCCGFCAGPDSAGGDRRGDERQETSGEIDEFMLHERANTMSTTAANPWHDIEESPDLLRQLAHTIQYFPDLTKSLKSAGILSDDDQESHGTDSVDFPKEIEATISDADLQDLWPEYKLKSILAKIKRKDDGSFRCFKRTLIENGEFKALEIIQPPSPAPASLESAPELPPPSPAVLGQVQLDQLPSSNIRDVPEVTIRGRSSSMSDEHARDVLDSISLLDEQSFRQFREQMLSHNENYDPIQVLSDTLHSVRGQIVDPVPPQFYTPRRSRQSALREEFMLEEVDARAAPVTSATAADSRETEQVRIRSAEKLVEGGRHVYSMVGHPRGICVIFNNRRFPSFPDKNRPGSDADESYMRQLFEAFGFTVHSYVDENSNDILQLLDTYAKHNVQESHEAFACIIMSHGEQHCIYGSDYNTVKLQDIFQLFNNTNCPRLRERPKIFLIQACRGYLPDNGEFARSGEGDAPESFLDKFADSVREMTLSEPGSSRTQSDAGMIAGTAPRTAQASTSEANGLHGASRAVARRIPSWSDMYIAYAVIEGYESLRDLNTGSWFLKAVYDVMARESWRHDLDTLMDLVSKIVIERKSYDGQRQCPEIKKIGWHKKLYFNTGL